MLIMLSFESFDRLFPCLGRWSSLKRDVLNDSYRDKVHFVGV